MAKKPFISVDGITVGEANALVNVIAANGDITTSNITVSNNANLGNVGNVIITGGSSGYVLSTNGSGNLNWVAQSGGGSSNISNGNSNVNIATANGNVTISVAGTSNVVNVTGSNVFVTANIIPTANITYDLGTSTNRFRDLYLSGNTINLGNSNLSANGTQLILTNPLGGEFIVGGNGIVNSADLTGYSIANGNSNVSVVANGNIAISSAGNANILIVTGTGANINGTANITGNVTLSGANVSLGAVGNLKITGGSNGYVLSTDGSGNLSWVSQSVSNANIIVDAFTGNGVQTVFTLSTTPTSEDFTIINIDGVSQLHSAYTVANANVTLSSAPASGAAIEVMTFNLGGGGSNSSSGYTYVEVTANTSASANTKYIVNTNTSNITVTLPSSPSLGTEVGIIDGTGNASVHAITVGRNGGNIQGTASDMTVTTNRSAFTLVYYNAAQGWILTNV
jgi:hypothetical protein